MRHLGLYGDGRRVIVFAAGHRDGGETLRASYAPGDMKVRIGCSGYYYRGWQGLWYPAGLKASHWFRYYADRFDTVEINATFYRFPTPSAVSRWIRQAPAGFVYSLKAPRLITHRKRLADCKEQIAAFYDAVVELGERLGCVLYQFPPSFHFTDENLSRVLQELRPGFRNVVEFRHRSWWCEQAVEALGGAGIIVASVDAPELPDDLMVTAPDLYLRLHGDPWYRQDYRSGELEEWALRIRAAKVDRCWIYFNNDTDAFAPKNAATLRRLMGEG